ncbi:unnamed protein product [Lactuca saligna]|uniref:Uncharacterized protein n=1 Tax=Lactuca saligna TaxID=75948 RepID=A0AA35ZVT1_LACSI|nr:unnamed protein product [Lactuca saligna]
MSWSHSDGALKIIDADEESIGPPLSVKVSNSPPMAMEANLVHVLVGDADRLFFPLSSDVADLIDSIPCEGVDAHPQSDRRSSPMMADQVFFGKDSPEFVKQEIESCFDAHQALAKMLQLKG